MGGGGGRGVVILVGRERRVPVLGPGGRLPVEVVPFAAPLAIRELADLGCRPVLRIEEGRPFVTDNANWIVDCGGRPIEAPAAFARDLRALPGVVDTGLYPGVPALLLLSHRRPIRWITHVSPR